MSNDLRTLPKPIKGAGLTNPGIVILQFLVILLFETIEYSIGKVGIITGLAIIVSIAGGFYLGRPGTSFTTVVNPPIVFFFCTIVLIATIGGAGVHVAKFGLDLVTTLGGAAPYLVVGTVIGWGYHLWSNRKPKIDEASAKSEVSEEPEVAVESLGFKEELN